MAFLTFNICFESIDFSLIYVLLFFYYIASWTDKITNQG